ncbi:MAG: aminoacetone oxidase family FAD-binding enzyme [Lachnospiraceae bacterium]|nr:aminoacetone oxidase family FAD-binding enzyme [Lachnospiraceae bacterium]
MNDVVSKKNTAIIGAGAAGLVAAFYALENGCSVTVFEKNEIAGKKLRITGNGRCNFTNEDQNVSHYEHYSDRAGADFLDSNALEYDLKLIAAILEKNGKDDFKEFLNLCGMPSFSKNGYYYPLMERAGELTDILVKVLLRKGVRFCFGENIRSIDKNESGKFIVNGESFDKLILACGGKAAPSTGSDGGGYKLARNFGHTVSFTYPVLVPLYADSVLLKEISGVRIKAKAYGIVDGEVFSSDSGEIQFTDSTISGIPVFQLSRHLTKAIEEKKDVRIRLDVLPDVDESDFRAFVSDRRNALNGVEFEEFFEGIFPKKYYEMLLKHYRVDKTESSDSEELYDAESKNTDFENNIRFLKYIKNFEFVITGHAGYENAQCTRGGVILSELNDTLESRLVPGLYIIGEMLDVDGDCGGYNLQWAFSSGKLVGEEV